MSISQAQVGEARSALAYCWLRVPFDGWIVKRTVDKGSLAGPATNGFTIADLQAVKAVFGIPDTMIAKLQRGQAVELSTDAVARPVPVM